MISMKDTVDHLHGMSNGYWRRCILIAHSKGFSDREIEQILRVCAESYLRQVYEFCKKPDEQFALTLKNTTR